MGSLCGARAGLNNGEEPGKCAGGCWGEDEEGRGGDAQPLKTNPGLGQAGGAASGAKEICWGSWQSPT